MEKVKKLKELEINNPNSFQSHEVKFLSQIGEGILHKRYIYSKNVRKEKMKQIPQVKETTKPTLNYINTEFNKINKRNKSFKELRGDKKVITSLIDDVYKTQENLFTEREEELLSKVIDEKYMNAYNCLYDSKKK